MSTAIEIPKNNARIFDGEKELEENSVIIEKKTGKFSNRSSFVNKSYNKNTNFRGKTFSTLEKTPFCDYHIDKST